MKKRISFYDNPCIDCPFINACRELKRLKRLHLNKSFCPELEKVKNGTSEYEIKDEKKTT